MNGNTQFETQIHNKFEGFRAEIPEGLWAEIKESLLASEKTEEREKEISNLIINNTLSAEVKHAVKLLAEMEWVGRYGKRLEFKDLRDLCKISSMNITIVMTQLREKGWVERFNNHYFLKIDLACYTLYDLVVAVDGGVRAGLDNPNNTPTDSGIITDIVERLRKIPLLELFTYTRF